VDPSLASARTRALEGGRALARTRARARAGAGADAAHARAHAAHAAHARAHAAHPTRTLSHCPSPTSRITNQPGGPFVSGGGGGRSERLWRACAGGCASARGIRWVVTRSGLQPSALALCGSAAGGRVQRQRTPGAVVGAPFGGATPLDFLGFPCTTDACYLMPSTKNSKELNY